MPPGEQERRAIAACAEIKIDVQLACPPTAQTLPLMGGTTACPDSSSPTRVQRFPMCWKGPHGSHRTSASEECARRFQAPRYRLPVGMERLAFAFCCTAQSLEMAQGGDDPVGPGGGLLGYCGRGPVVAAANRVPCPPASAIEATSSTPVARSASPIDPQRPSAVQVFCVARFLFIASWARAKRMDERNGRTWRQGLKTAGSKKSHSLSPKCTRQSLQKTSRSWAATTVPLYTCRISSISTSSTSTLPGAPPALDR